MIAEKKISIFSMWLQALAGKAVTPWAADEQKLRSLAGFDPLAEDAKQNRESPHGGGEYGNVQSGAGESYLAQPAKLKKH